MLNLPRIVDITRHILFQARALKAEVEEEKSGSGSEEESEAGGEEAEEAVVTEGFSFG